MTFEEIFPAELKPGNLELITYVKLPHSALCGAINTGLIQ